MRGRNPEVQLKFDLGVNCQISLARVTFGYGGAADDVRLRRRGGE